jgi:hypothetical protein
VIDGVEVYRHEFLTSIVDKGEWSLSRPSCFTSRGRSPGTHWIRGWVGARGGLDALDRIFSVSASKFQFPTTSSTVTVLTEMFWTAALSYKKLSWWHVHTCTVAVLRIAIQAH